MAFPKLLRYFGKLHKQMSSRYAFKPSYNIGHRQFWRSRHKTMDMVFFADFCFNNRKAFFIADLFQQLIKSF